ncbi:MAG: hypothetical protein IKD04_04880 [Clostridia bacterium]|nr:hypothetical protein [Clostridia bacterium]
MKNNTIKILTLILSFLLLLPCIFVHANGTLTPTIAVDTAEAVCGQTVELEVSLQNNPGIASFALDVGYDATKLIYNGATVNESFSSAAVNENFIFWYDWADSYYNGVVFTLSFTVKDAVLSGRTQISVNYDNETGGIINFGEENVDFAISSGYIDILSEIGDPNNDKKINSEDLVVLNQILFGNILADDVLTAVCDVKPDMEINILDLIRLKRYICGDNISLGNV